MRLLPKFLTAPATKVSKAWTLHFTGLNPVKWFNRDYESFAREAYQ